MQRIKLEVFKNFFTKNLSGNEIDFILTLTYLQDVRGIVRGLHYKDITEATGMSIQAFYDCKRTLQEKGIIEVKRGFSDYDVKIIGNDFSTYTDEDYKNNNVKYIHTNKMLFRDLNWCKLKPKQKLLVMDLLNINTAGAGRTYRIGRDKFYEKYTKLLQVTARTLQKYLKWLQLYFYVGIKDGIYLITVRREFAKRADFTEYKRTFSHIIRAACRRNKIKEQNSQEEKDIIGVLNTYRNAIGFIDPFRVFSKMVEVINDRIPNKRKWKRRLKASLFHKILKEELQMA